MRRCDLSHEIEAFRLQLTSPRTPYAPSAAANWSTR
jgi:hypothetical protein